MVVCRDSPDTCRPVEASGPPRPRCQWRHTAGLSTPAAETNTIASTFIATTIELWRILSLFNAYGYLFVCVSG